MFIKEIKTKDYQTGMGLMRYLFQIFPKHEELNQVHTLKCEMQESSKAVKILNCGYFLLDNLMCECLITIHKNESTEITL